jgi:hypothetical protein
MAKLLSKNTTVTTPLTIGLSQIYPPIHATPHAPVEPALFDPVAPDAADLNPKITLDLYLSRTHASRYPPNKTALHIKTWPGIPHTVLLLLHMIEVVPPEWRFLLLGSPDKMHQSAGTCGGGSCGWA